MKLHLALTSLLEQSRLDLSTNDPIAVRVGAPHSEPDIRPLGVVELTGHRRSLSLP